MALFDRDKPGSQALLDAAERLIPWLCTLWLTLCAWQALTQDGQFLGEGTDTSWAATGLRHVPLDVLFCLRARPGAALLPALAGDSEPWRLAIHVAMTLPFPWLLADLARGLQIGSPAVAALAGTLSLGLANAMQMGLGSSQSVVVLTFALWLWLVRDKPVSAGAILVLLPLWRPEGGLYALTAAAWSVRHRQWRLVGGQLLVGLPYWLVGAWFHHDVLWPVHFPPSVSRSCVDCGLEAIWGMVAPTLSIGASALALLNVSPLLLPGIGSLFRLQSDEQRPQRSVLQWLSLASVGYVLVATALPHLHVLTSGGARTILIVLPFCALGVAARWAEEDAVSKLQWRSGLALALALWVVAPADHTTGWSTALFALLCGALLFVQFFSPVARMGLLIGFLGVSVAGSKPDEGADKVRVQLAAAREWMGELATKHRKVTVFTDVVDLGYLQGIPSSVRIRAWVRPDVNGHLAAMSNARNGQTARLLALEATHWGAAGPDLAQGDWMLLADDPRGWQALPAALRTQLVVAKSDASVGLCLLRNTGVAQRSTATYNPCTATRVLRQLPMGSP